MPDRGARLTPVNRAPYLSVVATARNDDHGGNLLRRMQVFVNGLLVQCARHRVPAELILVEWNPPADRPGLAEALDWSARSEFCDARIICVPAEVHRRFAHSAALGLYQMIAKNVGIRRARGEFVLATNIDILFSDELFRLLAERRLARDRMYRVDRWDAMTDVPLEQPVEEQLRWCNAHLLRVNRREGTYAVHPDGSLKIDARDIVSPERGVTLGANWFPREMSGDEPFRWVQNDAEIVLSRPAKFLKLEVEPGPGADAAPLALELRDAGGRVMASAEIAHRTTLALPVENAASRILLHTGGGGRRIATDLRTLNFRVFRCEPAESGLAGAAPARVRAGWFARMGRAARVVGAALVRSSEIRIPMSRAALERLDLRQDGSAVAFFVGPLLGRARARAKIPGRGLAAIWGEGWYDLERFRGETFRWMQRQASLTLILPESGARAISMLVEAGPAAGFRGAALEVRDPRGALLSQQKLAGRTRVQVPIGEVRGAWTLDLKVVGGEAPREIPGDSRSLALRVLSCELDPVPRMSRERELSEIAPGIWSMRGCMRRGEGIVCADGAELLLRGEGELSLEMGAQEAAATVAIRDARGAALFEGTVAETRRIPLGAPRGWVLLRISTDRPLNLPAVVRQDGRVPLRSRMAAPVHLHTNGCGDFTLMARERWFDLRGYAEFDAFSMNIDSMLCWAAHHGGAREEVLGDPIRIFHVEHATGSGWTPEGERKLYQRIAAGGVPWVEFNDVLAWAGAMNQYASPMIFNGENWGLRDLELPEISPQTGCNARGVEL